MPDSESHDEDVKQIAALPKLETLRLSSPHLTDAALAHLANSETLRHLILFDTPITDAGLRAVGRETLACRAASVVAGLTGVRLAVDSPVEHEVSRSDDPERQAEDERVQIRRARAVMDAFVPSPATRVRDTARERHMARRLESLRLWGDVVAVVGHGHLDPLVDRLTGDGVV